MISPTLGTYSSDNQLPPKRFERTELGLVKTLLFSALFVLTGIPSSYGQRVNMQLRNGMSIESVLMRPKKDSIKRQGEIHGNANSGAKVICEVDDGLRTILFHDIQLKDGQQENWTIARKEVSIVLTANRDLVATNAPQPRSFGAAPQLIPFSDLGRRFYRFPGGELVVQGITEVTPRYIKVEGLRGPAGELAWDMRMSFDSIDPETLYSILVRNAEPNSWSDYRDIVELFETAGNFVFARRALVDAIQKFPELENNKSKLKEYDQRAADQLFAAANKARRQAGQHQLAKRILEQLPYDVLSLETRLKADAEKEKLANERKDHEQLIQNIAMDIVAINDPAIRSDFERVLDEIRTFLTLDTEGRFADYRRLRENTKSEQRAALAIGGWIYGAGLADDNLTLVASGVKAKQLIAEYLSKPTRNNQVLEDLIRLESGTPRYVSRIVANMAPSFPTPQSSLYPIRSPDPNQPEKITETIVPGRYVLEVPLWGQLQGQTAYYLVQLPPEYNPYRRYPCVVTMHSEYSTPEDQLNWWCGQFDSKTNRCWGEASRNGYIVVAPFWAKEKQPEYYYTENEHAMVLASLLDAKRRFSIDTDRVFLSGHSMGGSATWDIALAHPDLWAGCIVICGLGEKYVKQYFGTARYVPMYFVTGEKAADNGESHVVLNEQEWDKLLRSRQFDVMIQIYNGRGLDHFQEELPHIMQWMNSSSHVRNFAPQRFEVETCRYGDKFFWWFATDQLLPSTTRITHPHLYRDGDGYKIEGSINKVTNSVSMDTVPADAYTIYLTSEMLDVTKLLTVSHKGKTKKVEPKLDTRVMLEDVHRRVDRQHPFWVKIPIPN
jgi:pimeloyl-ACP methyl ester carboxylesterase